MEAEANGAEQRPLPQPEAPPEFEASQPAVAAATVTDLPVPPQPKAADESAAAAELAHESAPVAELASVPAPAEDVVYESAAAADVVPHSVPAATANLKGLPPTAAAAAGDPPSNTTAALGPVASLEQPLSARIEHDGGELPAPRYAPPAAKETGQGHCAAGQMLQHVPRVGVFCHLGPGLGEVAFAPLDLNRCSPTILLHVEASLQTERPSEKLSKLLYLSFKLYCVWKTSKQPQKRPCNVILSMTPDDTSRRSVYLSPVLQYAGPSTSDHCSQCRPHSRCRAAALAAAGCK